MCSKTSPYAVLMFPVCCYQVAYLTVKGWLDDRQEKQDREAPVLTRWAVSPHALVQSRVSVGNALDACTYGAV